MLQIAAVILRLGAECKKNGGYDCLMRHQPARCTHLPLAPRSRQALNHLM